MSVGEKLREARVARGFEISGLAAQLKIQARYLAAIEADQRDQLPSAFLFKNWVRQYAEVLGVDYAGLRSEVEGLVAADAPLRLPGQEQWTVHRKAAGSHGRHGAFRLVASLATLVVIVAAGSGAYAWWRGDLQGIEWPKLRIWPGNVQANTAVRPPVKVDTALAPVVAAPVPSAPVAAAPVVEAPVPAMRLEISAREATWISISPDGTKTFSGVLQANETRSVQAFHSTLVKVGNAGGLDVRLNGASIGEIGPRGKIRILVVTPEGVKILDPKDLAKPAQPASV